MEEEKTIQLSQEEIKKLIANSEMIKRARSNGGKTTSKKRLEGKSREEISAYMSKISREEKIPKEV